MSVEQVRSKCVGFVLFAHRDASVSRSARLGNCRNADRRPPRAAGKVN